MSSSYIEVELNRQPVELCKLLKIANLVSGGGEAKVVISEGYVLLNGEVEYQKRKKIYHEDIIEFNGETIQLIINDKMPEPVENTATAPASSRTKKKAHKNQPPSSTEAVTTETVTLPKKRRPISF